MDSFGVSPTSRDSAECDPIVLRVTNTTRLIFSPLMTNNVNDASASVNGTFVFQKKGRKGEWSDLKTLDLSQLKSGDWIKLHLHADEVKKLVQGITDLYSVHASEGIPSEDTRYIKAEANISALLGMRDPELAAFLESAQGVSIEVFTRLLKWVVKAANPEEVVDKIEHLEAATLQKLNTLVGIGNLKKVLSIWQANKTNPCEEFWQQLLAKYPFVLSQVFAMPVILLKGKAYVGGKSIKNAGGNIVDFLLAHKLTGNAALVEIKTPVTPLLASEYRTGIYAIAEELVGAVMQVLDYKDSLTKEYHSLAGNTPEQFYAFEPSCLVIAGNLEATNLNTSQCKSLELYRNNLVHVKVITYDELFSKVGALIELLEGNATTTQNQ